RNSPASSWRPAPLARDANTATGVSSPTPMMKKRLKTPTPKDDAARGTAPVRPIITLSAIPMSIWPTWPMTIGTARSSVARDSRMTSFIDEIYSGPAGVVHRYLRRRAAPPRGAGAPSAHLAHADRVHLRRRVRRREPDDLGRAAGERERLPRGRAPDRRPLVVQEHALDLHARGPAFAVLHVRDHLEAPVPERALLQAGAVDRRAGRGVERGEAVRVLDRELRRVPGRLGGRGRRAPGEGPEAAERRQEADGGPYGHSRLGASMGYALRLVQRGYVQSLFLGVRQSFAGPPRSRGACAGRRTLRQSRRPPAHDPLRPRDRPGHDLLPRDPLRQARAARRLGAAGVPPALPAPRLGGARPPGPLGHVARGRPGGAQEGRRRTRGRRRRRHREPARDHPGLGARDGPPDPQGDRL